MEKRVILLAKSKKLSNYCIAGIDIDEGKWIRIVSEDRTIQHAVTEEDMKYEDGTLPRTLDVVQIVCKEQCPNYYQPENCTLDNSYYWKKVGRATLQDVLRLHPSRGDRYLFYNSDKAIHDKDIVNMNACDIYSLVLIKPQLATIHVQQWDRKKVTASFKYNDIWYKYLTITDLEYAGKFLEYVLGDYPIRKSIYFVVSLGDTYIRDKRHYKLIATVLE